MTRLQLSISVAGLRDKNIQGTRWRRISYVCRANASAEHRERRNPIALTRSWRAARSLAAGHMCALLVGLGTPALAATLPGVFEPEMDPSLFDIDRYTGLWYEVASKKEGFAGAGQEDCHCTQGLYKKIRFDQLEVSTFCFHGGPNGRLSGITGSVTCADPAALELLPEFKTDLEARLRIRVKCVLRFPAVPFVPPEPYNVIRTDYETFALVQGARDFSFVQVYSRTPNPGPEFIAARLKELDALGYDVSSVVKTPQDCETMTESDIQGMMGAAKSVNIRPGGQAALRLQQMTASASEPTAALESGIQVNPSVNPIKLLGDLFGLFKEEVTEGP